MDFPKIRRVFYGGVYYDVFYFEDSQIMCEHYIYIHRNNIFM